jgi:hypothetical protein
MRSSSRNKPMTARRLAGAAAVIMTLILAGAPATMAQADSDTTDSYKRYATTKQGADRATFDRFYGDFEVCDNEKDGRAVYACFSATAEDGSYYYDDTKGACTTFAGTKSGDAGIMYVCERKDNWWDLCSDGVVTFWKQ